MGENQNQDAQLDTSLRRSVHVFTSHEDARAHEIRGQARKSPYRRLVEFAALRRRVWGDDHPDVRESGVVKISQRDS